MALLVNSTKHDKQLTPILLAIPLFPNSVPYLREPDGMGMLCSLQLGLGELQLLLQHVNLTLELIGLCLFLILCCNRKILLKYHLF